MDMVSAVMWVMAELFVYFLCFLLFGTPIVLSRPLIVLGITFIVLGIPLVVLGILGYWIVKIIKRRKETK